MKKFQETLSPAAYSEETKTLKFDDGTEIQFETHEESQKGSLNLKMERGIRGGFDKGGRLEGEDSIHTDPIGTTFKGNFSKGKHYGEGRIVFPAKVGDWNDKGVFFVAGWEEASRLGGWRL